MPVTSTGLESVYEPDPHAVYRRLEELGVPPDVVMESVRIGYGKADFTTAAHPPTYPGTVVWGEITGAFRERMAIRGWGIKNEENVPKSISPDGIVRIVAVRGNDKTGVRSAHEQLSTRRPRGNAGVRIIKMNTQYELCIQDGGRSANLAPGMGGTWFLLYNRVGDVVRIELSFASAVNRSGNLIRWSERLILPDLDLLEPPTSDGVVFGSDPSPEVDVPVARRAG